MVGIKIRWGAMTRVGLGLTQAKPSSERADARSALANYLAKGKAKRARVHERSTAVDPSETPIAN